VIESVDWRPKRNTGIEKEQQKMKDAAGQAHIEAIRRREKAWHER